MKFKPGQSGNPKGRTPGKTPATLIRQSIREAMPEIIKTLADQAKAGDVQAAKVLLDRVCPSLKPQALPVNIPAGPTLPAIGNHVVEATISGSNAPDIGSMLIRALAEQGKLIELQELTDRLRRIERQLEDRTT